MKPIKYHTSADLKTSVDPIGIFVLGFVGIFVLFTVFALMAVMIG